MIYYSECTFSLKIDVDRDKDSYDVLAAFFEALGQQGCKQLSCMDIKIDSPHKAGLLDMLPFARMFSRPSGAFLKVSSIFVDYLWWHGARPGGGRRVEADPWATEPARDLAEVGRILWERGCYDPSDEMIKTAGWYWLPVLNRGYEKCLRGGLWDSMEPAFERGMEQWLLPLPLPSRESGIEDG